MEFWHFIQHALFKSVFTSPRWLDFIWVGPSLQGRNWRHMVMQTVEDVTENEDLACIGHVAFVSVFISPCGPHLIALGWFSSNLAQQGQPNLYKCDVKLHASILCNNNLFASVFASSRWPDEILLGPILTPCNHPNSYICDGEWRPRILCSILRSHSFYLPSVARFKVIAADFLLNRLHRIFQPSEDVTANLVSAVYILQLYQFLAVFSAQISFDGGRLSRELIPWKILRICKHITGTCFH